MPDYIDIHCHLDDEMYASDKADVLARLKEKNTWAITIGTDNQSSENAVKIAEENDGIFSVIGIHPRYEETFDEKHFAHLAQSEKVVGVGECGLDYFRIDEADLPAEKKRQYELFEAQIAFAVKNDLPLMLHCRDAYDDVVTVLESKAKEHGDGLKGNAHFFAGDLSIAKRLWTLGFSTSFTGVITFARDYDEIIKQAPQHLIMSETDAPYVAPIPYRGKRNEPVYVSEVVHKIAEIRGEERGVVMRYLIQNAVKAFKII
jgi:TatD DNase family protein